MEDFEAFLGRRRRAASAYVSGDGSQLDALVPHHGEASFHSPGGDTVTGAEIVAARYLQDAGGFEPGGETEIEILQQGASGEIGFWTGFQIATVRPLGKPESLDMRLRITEVFCRIDGEWRLIHRHADFGAKPG
jgi:ketosteroid isomerase-like protein